MLLAAGVAPSRLRELSEEEQRLRGLDKLKAVAVGDPRGHARRLLRADTDRRPRNAIPATTRCSALFKQRTGCPVLVNTSFNVRGEPIVCTPEDALRCFLNTEIDALAIGNCFLRKEAQHSGTRPDHAYTFGPD